MIRSVKVQNYKCLGGVQFRLSNLTLLTGTNSVGKSSFMQTLLLARLATLAVKGHATAIPLNGPFGLSLGEFVDIVRHTPDGKSDAEIKISLSFSSRRTDVRLSSDSSSARYAHVKYKSLAAPALSAIGLGNFCYLSAEREGPRDFGIVQSRPKEELEIGFQGQFVANVLQVCERDPVRKVLQHSKAPGQRLLKQVEAWLSDFVPGVEIRAEFATGVDVVSVRFMRGGVASEWERPSNTGFGVSYSLPIVVAGLVAKKGSLLLVDSPEAHLHPSAQSAMGSFLGRVAATGVQVVVETHSDHVLNGIRLAALRNDHPLSRTNVLVNHLRQIEGVISKEEISINARGELSSRPTEFFDQAERDLAAIVRQRFR